MQPESRDSARRKLIPIEAKYSRSCFTVRTESLSKIKKEKRKYSSELKTGDLTNQLNKYFEYKIEIPGIKVGRRQTIETPINEEALLFAKYLRDERETWAPRIAVL